MISCNSTLASSQPATSAKVSLGVSPASSRAFDFPKENARCSRLQLAQEEEPEADDHDPGQSGDEEIRDAHLRLLGRNGHASLLQLGQERFAVGDGKQDREGLRLTSILRNRGTEFAFHLATIVHRDGRDIADLQLLLEGGVSASFCIDAR